MSLQVSFEDFHKMVNKECLKQTGLNLIDIPTIFCEDFWPGDYQEVVTIQDAKVAMEFIMEAILEVLEIS
jgi:hypothetical protein